MTADRSAGLPFSDVYPQYSHIKVGHKYMTESEDALRCPTFGVLDLGKGLFE